MLALTVSLAKGSIYPIVMATHCIELLHSDRREFQEGSLTVRSHQKTTWYNSELLHPHCKQAGRGSDIPGAYEAPNYILLMRPGLWFLPFLGK